MRAVEVATGAAWKVMGALLLIHVVVAIVNLSPLIDSYTVGLLLDVNLEGTAVVWLSSATLLVTAMLALVAGFEVTGATRRGWMAVVAVFTLASLDETASLHEMVGEKAARFFEIDWLPSIYMWVVVVAPPSLAVAVWMVRWFRATVAPRPARLVMLAVAAWVMVPVLEALDPALGGPRLLIVVEETLEGIGEALFLGSLVVHLAPSGLTRDAGGRILGRNQEDR